jgi:hypothetical protein
MDSLFGIPMNAIMIIVVVMLIIAFGTIAFAALRNRVMFLSGCGSPRKSLDRTHHHRAYQSTHISAAFTTGIRSTGHEDDVTPGRVMNWLIQDGEETEGIDGGSTIPGKSTSCCACLADDRTSTARP